MLTLIRVKQLMADYNFRPNKRLGQNFMIDKNITDKIIKFLDPLKEEAVLEIGAGLGNMTGEISARAKKVIAVEYDRLACEVLKNQAAPHKNVEVVCGDILKFDFLPYAKYGPLRIIGNLPYYITTPILEHIINNRRFVKDALVMVQKEVGERMLASPGGKEYGSLTCYLNYYMRPRFIRVVKKASFFPAPKVDSALVYFEVLGSPRVCVNNEGVFFNIIRSSFNQRRKTLLSSLTNKKVSGLDREGIKAVLEAAGISPQRRPETLSLEEFAEVANGFPG